MWRGREEETVLQLISSVAANYLQHDLEEVACACSISGVIYMPPCSGRCASSMSSLANNMYS